MSWLRGLLLLLPGGSILFLLSMATGIGAPPHSPTLADGGINIFDKTPYKEQLFKRKFPGECYDESNTWPNGQKILDKPKYGPCSEKSRRRNHG